MNNLVWQPLPGSQVVALSCPASHTLYEGTRGPGKTDIQLWRFRMRVGMGYGAFWNGIIFDRSYKNLTDIVNKSTRWFHAMNDGAKFSSGSGGYRWTWPTGESLSFRHIKRSADYWLYHGHEYPWIGWNELCRYPTSELYDAMMSCNRTSFLPHEHPLPDGSLLPEIPLEVFSTANPYGPGHNWVKRRFIDAGPPGSLIRNTVNVFNPRTQQREDVVRTQCRIFGSYKENKYLSPEYIAELESISDENKRKAWLWGDWDIVAGGAFDDLWNAAVLVKPRFKVPKTWRIDRSFDWGSTHPFSVGWWAEANGEEVVLPSGRRWCPVKGSLIRIAEWYGTREIGSNAGLKLSAAKVAAGIKEREASMLQAGWIQTTPRPGPADNQIGNINETDTKTIRQKMEDGGIKWTDSDKRAGSRHQGLELIRGRMEASIEGEGPGIYFMDNCHAAIATLPTLPRDEDDPDDVDSSAEDHVYDDVRYRVLDAERRVSVTNLPI